MADGDLIFQTARVYGEGPYARWAARCFVVGPRTPAEESAEIVTGPMTAQHGGGE